MPVSPSTYLYASVVVGLAQVLDALVLAKFKGRIGAIATSFSLAEYLWAGVSFFVWRDAQPPFPLWLPVSFVAYVAAFAAAGLVLAAMHRGELKPIPNHLVAAGGVFGAYFCATSLFYAAGA